MWIQQYTRLLFVLGFTSLCNALPGLQAQDFPNKLDGMNHELHGNVISTSSDWAATASVSDVPSSITPGPSIIAQVHRRDAKVVSVTCGTSVCSFFDVSSSLLTVMPLANITGSPTAPFANGTGTSQPHIGPTASGTGIVSDTATSTTSSGVLNNTTLITSRVTMSVTTVTAGNWNDWTAKPMGTGASSGRQPVAANTTNSQHSWSAWPMSTKGPQRTSSAPANSTRASPDQTLTRACSANETACSASTTASYVTTETLVFSGSTVVIPIPNGFVSSRTSHSTTAHTSKHSTPSLVGGSISTSSCWTTTVEHTSDTISATATATSKICWIISCDDDDNCPDQISRYPVTVDAQSTSLMTSHMTNTVMATTTQTGSSNGSAHTVMPTSSHGSMWMTWSNSRNATTKSSSSGTSSRSTTHTRSVDATSGMFESTYNPWIGWSSTLDTVHTQSSSSIASTASNSISVSGTITRSVSPLPASSSSTATTTSDPGFNARGAMMNRKRYLREIQHRVNLETEEKADFEINKVDS